MMGLIRRRAARSRRRSTVIALAATLLFAVVGCAGGNSAGGDPDSVTIAYQPGISYTPLIIMKSQKVLEKQFPKTKFSWKVLSSTAAIQDAIISGDVQIGAGSPAQLILGWDKGVDWRFLASINDADLWLMAKDPNVRSLKDIKPTDKIAMPSPTSVQALVLRKGAERELGNARPLDTNITSLSMPDGLQALMSGQVAGHLNSMPFQYQEQQQGAHVILHSNELFGRHTHNGVFATNRFYNAHTAFAQQVYRDLADAIQMISSDPDNVAKILSADSNGTPTAAEYKDYLTNPTLTYTPEPHGLMTLATFMKQIKLTDKTPQSWKDLVFPTAQNLDGS